MIRFDALDYPYASRRTVVYASHGMCCAGNPHAASAGLQALLRGGNAVDAALAMSFSLPVVEPTGNGLGSDCFCILWYKGKLYGINASGPSPETASIGAMRERGFESIPHHGIETVDVPGCVAGWIALHDKFGAIGLDEITETAVRYAEEGFPVTPTISYLWGKAFDLYSGYKDRPEFEPWFQTFAPKGAAPGPGVIFRCPDMGRTIREIAATNGESFYRGAIAERIGEWFGRNGGFLTADDLAAYKPEWVEPISTNYRGYDVWEMPPNGIGISVLMTLNILRLAEAGGREDPETVHRQIEALKLSMTDAAAHVTDPAWMRCTPEQLLSPEYAAARAALIGERAVNPTAGVPSCPSTVYVCAADKDGNMVSMIQSNFRGFGSGMVVPGTGISINDRLNCFTMEEGHPNALAGRKKPFHTIIPGFLTKGGEPVGPFGIMGGLMQPQAHVQVVQNMIDWHLNPQQALDAPRWQWTGGRNVQVEQDFPNHLAKHLVRRGHNVAVVPDSSGMGRGQVIVRDRNGVLCGGTEKRTDGQIMSY